MGPNELTALDVVGYNLGAAPEPRSISLIFGGFIVAAFLYRPPSRGLTGIRPSIG